MKPGRKVLPSDLDIKEHDVHITKINETLNKYEKKIEDFKNRQLGFYQANKYWITIVMVTVVNALVSVFGPIISK